MNQNSHLMFLRIFLWFCHKMYTQSSPARYKSYLLTINLRNNILFSVLFFLTVRMAFFTKLSFDIAPFSTYYTLFGGLINLLQSFARETLGRQPSKAGPTYDVSYLQILKSLTILMTLFTKRTIFEVDSFCFATRYTLP